MEFLKKFVFHKIVYSVLLAVFLLSTFPSRTQGQYSNLTDLFRSDAPEGGSGCSLKWFLGSGWCWRYCKGSSGEWCYTESGCRFTMETCAEKTKCHNSCQGSSDGCVTSCSKAKSEVSEELSNKPIGASGCSKKVYFGGSRNGYCWRYCRLNSGNWCYTTSSCLGKEESCAEETECAGISCWGADPGCVTECPRRESEVAFFKDSGFRGELLNMTTVTKCTNLPERFQGNVESLVFSGSCVRLYSKSGCSGTSWRVLNGNYKDLTYGMSPVLYFLVYVFDRQHRTFSVGPCYKYESYCRSNRLNSRSCRFLADTSFVGEVFQRPYHYYIMPSGVPVRYQLGENERILYADFEIRDEHLGQGSEPNNAAREFVRVRGRSGDHAGHILASRLGGTGRDTRNIFPQDAHINSGAWSHYVEDMVYNLAARDGRVRFEVNLEYNDTDYPDRPSFIIYRITNSNGMIVLVNDMVNDS